MLEDRLHGNELLKRGLVDQEGAKSKRNTSSFRGLMVSPRRLVGL